MTAVYVFAAVGGFTTGIVCASIVVGLILHVQGWI